MKKYLQFFSVLIVFALLVIAKNSLADNQGGARHRFGLEGDDDRAVVAPQSLLLSPSPNPSSAAIVTTSSQKGKYKDGTYKGSVADAYYGNLQIEATISNGRLTDVTFLQYPNDNHTSIRINTAAMPYLKQEALQAQSANVDTVSGASASSAAFQQSLESALKQAT